MNLVVGKGMVVSYLWGKLFKVQIPVIKLKCFELNFLLWQLYL